MPTSSLFLQASRGKKQCTVANHFLRREDIASQRSASDGSSIQSVEHKAPDVESRISLGPQIATKDVLHYCCEGVSDGSPRCFWMQLHVRGELISTELVKHMEIIINPCGKRNISVHAKHDEF